MTPGRPVLVRRILRERRQSVNQPLKKTNSNVNQIFFLAKAKKTHPVWRKVRRVYKSLAGKHKENEISQSSSRLRMLLEKSLMMN